MEESLPPSSRIDKTAPFHAQFEAAFGGVSRAISAVEEISASEEFASFIQSDYSHKISATLKVEVDGFKRWSTRFGAAPANSLSNEGAELYVVQPHSVETSSS